MFRNDRSLVSLTYIEDMKAEKKVLCYSYAICYVKVVFSPRGAFLLLFAVLVNRNFNLNYYQIYICDCFLKSLLLLPVSVFFLSYLPLKLLCW